MKKFYWSGISNDDRIRAIDEITGIIDGFGIILHSSRFSDISFNLSIEVEEGKVNDLYNRLKSIIYLEGKAEETTDSKSDCMILLNVSFTRGTGNLKIELPNVPG